MQKSDQNKEINKNKERISTFLNLRQLNQKNLSLSQIQLAYEQQISTLGAQIIDLRE